MIFKKYVTVQLIDIRIWFKMFVISNFWSKFQNGGW